MLKHLSSSTCEIVLAIIFAGVVSCRSIELPGPSIERAEASNQALKASLTLPTISSDFVNFALTTASYDALEAAYLRLFNNYQQDILHESPLQKGYDLFSPSNEVMIRYVDAWISASGSDIAYAAHGYYMMNLAGSIRGQGGIRSVPRQNLNEMQRYCAQAAEEFRIALEKNPMLAPAWVGLVRVAMMADLPFSPDEVFHEALQHDQRSVYLRQQYMKSLEPRWGGGYEAMLAFANQCAADADLNPRFWSLVGAVYADQAASASQNGDHRRAADLYSRALQYGDKLDWLQYRGNSLSKCGEYERAMADVDQILFYAPDYSSAPLLAAQIRQLKSGR